ncbi:BrnT family toxin [Phreatobacter sp.]|uniref:BrnT family toxin n=1 Tax=Phreatobacter sp. TaxID=1966341 RepID=UPI0025E3C591|nr:BrnT family toxin [Phreatobacter sp.]
MEFEWDENKRLANIEKHGIDFRIAITVFFATAALRRSDRSEERWITIGPLRNRLVAGVWTPRGEAKPIISARPARPDEREDYTRHVGGHPVG